jgi:hypothetical protein
MKNVYQFFPIHIFYTYFQKLCLRHSQLAAAILPPVCSIAIYKHVLTATLIKASPLFSFNTSSHSSDKSTSSGSSSAVVSTGIPSVGEVDGSPGILLSTSGVVTDGTAKVLVKTPGISVTTAAILSATVALVTTAGTTIEGTPAIFSAAGILICYYFYKLT